MLYLNQVLNIFIKITNKQPVVGSSNKIISGPTNISIPIDVLFFSPPDKPLIKLFPIYVF